MYSTLNAGWGSSAVMSSIQNEGVVYSHMTNVPSSWTNRILKSSFDAFGYFDITKPNLANISNFTYPQRRISMSKSWMDIINPTVVLPNNSTEKLISLLLSTQKNRDGGAYHFTEESSAVLLNFLLATALSETGAGYDWEGIYQQE